MRDGGRRSRRGSRDAHVSDYQWLHFDDDVVEEMNPSQLVTNSAHVLFYRRRRLTPSVINLTVSARARARALSARA